MYGREYAGRELHFEPSGGLIAASLVMMDKETDSYWSLMEGVSLAGDYRGTRLLELTSGAKTQWKEWVALHPDTLVLSIDGIEHEPVNPYDNYVTAETSYRGAEAADRRLPTKTSIYSFEIDGRAYAAPFSAFEGGRVFEIGEVRVFLHRPVGVSVFESTAAFVGGEGAFRQEEGAWVHRPSGASFDAKARQWVGGEGTNVVKLEGFDTFWFNWSMVHPETEILD